MTFPAAATQLRWYFGPGQSIAGHSASGSMFDRAQAYDNNDARRDKKIQHGMKRQEDVRRLERGEIPCVMSFKGEPEITAKPTAEVRPAPSNEVDDTALFRFAKVSTGLSRLGRVHEQGPDVLKARYGDGCADWEVKGFILGGIYIMTESGRRLFRSVADDNAKRGIRLDLSASEMLENDYQRAARHGDVERLRQFGAAHGAATRLLAEVSHVWNRLHEGD